MITITETAKDKITERCANFVRLSLSGGGCNGFQYEWSEEVMPQDNDYVIENRMVIDDLSMNYLWGSIIDWHETAFESGFEVHNPNAQTACGCGVSIGF